MKQNESNPYVQPPSEVIEKTEVYSGATVLKSVTYTVKYFTDTEERKDIKFDIDGDTAKLYLENNLSAEDFLAYGVAEDAMREHEEVDEVIGVVEQIEKRMQDGREGIRESEVGHL